MYFTQEDFQKIENYFKEKAYKDTDFRLLPPSKIEDEDIVAIVHKGTNYRINFKTLAEKVSDIAGKDTIEVEDRQGNNASGRRVIFDKPVTVNQISSGVMNVKFNSATSTQPGVVTVDESLSTTSQNPIQNKTITNNLHQKQNTSDYLTYWEINHIIADVFGF